MNKYFNIIIIIIIIYFIFYKNNNLEKFTQIPNGYNNVVLSNENGDLQSIDNKSFLDNAIPKGVIVAWSGNSAPEGWNLCDGLEGRPDLRGRFILGWTTNNTNGLVTNDPHTNITVNEINQKRGKEKVILTKEQLPDHNHNYSRPDNYSCSCGGGGCVCGGANDKTGGLENAGQPHDNMPPYFVLAYIIKI
jgi:microcystin-dependent protein